MLFRGNIQMDLKEIWLVHCSSGVGQGPVCGCCYQCNEHLDYGKANYFLATYANCGCIRKIATF